MWFLVFGKSLKMDYGSNFKLRVTKKNAWEVLDLRSRTSQINFQDDRIDIGGILVVLELQLNGVRSILFSPIDLGIILGFLSLRSCFTRTIARQAIAKAE